MLSIKINTCGTSFFCDDNVIFSRLSLIFSTRAFPVDGFQGLLSQLNTEWNANECNSDQKRKSVQAELNHDCLGVTLTYQSTMAIGRIHIALSSLQEQLGLTFELPVDIQCMSTDGQLQTWQWDPQTNGIAKPERPEFRAPTNGQFNDLKPTAGKWPHFSLVGLSDENLYAEVFIPLPADHALLFMNIYSQCFFLQPNKSMIQAMLADPQLPGARLAYLLFNNHPEQSASINKKNFDTSYPFRAEVTYGHGHNDLCGISLYYHPIHNGDYLSAVISAILASELYVGKHSVQFMTMEDSGGAYWPKIYTINKNSTNILQISSTLVEREFHYNERGYREFIASISYATSGSDDKISVQRLFKCPHNQRPDVKLRELLLLNYEGSAVMTDGKSIQLKNGSVVKILQTNYLSALQAEHFRAFIPQLKSEFEF